MMLVSLIFVYFVPRPKYDQNLPDSKYAYKTLPKTVKMSPKWQNFAIPGHTAAL